MDMCNEEILSFSIDKRPSAANVINALDKVIRITSELPLSKNISFWSRLGLPDENMLSSP